MPLIIAVCICFLLPGGCSDPNTSARKSGTSNPLIVGVGADGFVTKGNQANLGAYPLNANVYETLVGLTPDFKVKPLLAADWEYRGGNTWRFYLRHGVNFHDGRDFTADAVKYTMDRIAKNGGSFINIGYHSTRIVDDYTVDITPERPNRRLVEGLVHPKFSILAPGGDFGRSAVGTGPLKLVSYSTDQCLITEKYLGYWGVPSRSTRVTFRFIADSATRTMALQAGELDLTKDLHRESAAYLINQKQYKIIQADEGAYVAISLSINGKKPFDLMSDRNLRRALALGIERESIVKEIWEGGAQVGNTVIPPSVLGAECSKICGPYFDPEKAIQLLEDTGWAKGRDGIREKDGRPLRLTLVSGFPNARVHRPVPEIIQGQLRKIGIDVEIVEINDTGVYLDRLKTGRGDLWLEAGRQNSADPTFLPYLLFHTDGEYALISDGLFAPGDEFDQLVDLARKTPDIHLAVKYIATAMGQLIDDEVAVIPLASMHTIYAMNERVRGFLPHPSAIFTNWSNVFLQ